ncbi:hypothetical protein SAMN04487967_1773 [Natronorubrum sediminis]|uniref:HIT zinc finger n=1 Tax=Natronorubrum sediminis TaxID=640943 RepID=A0A1H6FVJ2_9EURY|nr:hypothetical protein [Natronorubrum sediminis]SEH14797.1 hypothetical protein SAMN04487967_1773 [Natronorubrum sediminis]
MSVSGLCQICESKPAQHQCANCGTLVCTDHYERDAQLCVQCATQANPSRQSDDVDINRF